MALPGSPESPAPKILEKSAEVELISAQSFLQVQVNPLPWVIRLLIPDLPVSFYAHVSRCVGTFVSSVNMHSTKWNSFPEERLRPKELFTK